MDANDKLYCLACKPDPRAHTFTGCIVDGVRYHTKELDDRRTTQNSGVYVPGVFVGGTHDYYGVLLSIVRLRYVDMHQVFLFKCKWFNTNETGRDVKRRVQHDYNLMSINTHFVWYENEPYILASEAQQMFYLDDPKLGHGWKVVQKVQLRHVWDVPELDDEEEEVLEEDCDPVPGNDVYQQDEFNDIQWLVAEEDLENPQLHQKDVEAEVIDSNLENDQWMEDSDDGYDDNDDDEESDTDGYDEEILSSDDDDSD